MVLGPITKIEGIEWKLRSVSSQAGEWREREKYWNDLVEVEG
jgi:hypothetical protein